MYRYEGSDILMCTLDLILFALHAHAQWISVNISFNLKGI